MRPRSRLRASCTPPTGPGPARPDRPTGRLGCGPGARARGADRFSDARGSRARLSGPARLPRGFRLPGEEGFVGRLGRAERGRLTGRHAKTSCRAGRPVCARGFFSKPLHGLKAAGCAAWPPGIRTGSAGAVDAAGSDGGGFRGLGGGPGLERRDRRRRRRRHVRGFGCAGELVGGVLGQGGRSRG